MAISIICAYHKALETMAGDLPTVWHAPTTRPEERADHLVPSIDGHLTGDQNRSGIVAVFHDLQQVAGLLGSQRLGAPVVEHKQLAEQLGGAGAIVLLSGLAEAEPAQRRLCGARSVFAGFDDIRILAVEWTDWQGSRP